MVIRIFFLANESELTKAPSDRKLPSSRVRMGQVGALAEIRQPTTLDWARRPSPTFPKVNKEDKKDFSGPSNPRRSEVPEMVA